MKPARRRTGRPSEQPVVPVTGAERRSPAERYIKMLIVTFGSNDAVRDVMARKRIDDGDRHYVDRLRSEFALPKKFDPYDKTDEAGQQLLARHGLLPLVHRDAAMVEALQILEHERAREIVETLILAGGPPDAIAAALSRLRWKYTPAGIAQFVNAFWDIGLLSRTSLRAVLAERERRAVEAAREESPGSAEAVRRAWRRDPRVMVIEQPPSLTTFAGAALRLGVPLEKVDLRKALATVQTTAVLRAAENVHLEGSRPAQRAVALMNVAQAASELLAASTDPIGSLRDELATVRLKATATPLPMIGSLPGGHSVGLEPAREARHEDDMIDP